MSSDIKKIIRPKDGRIVAGVCLAVAHYIGIDVTIVRIIFVLLLLPGFLPYVLLWILVPEEKQ